MQTKCIYRVCTVRVTSWRHIKIRHVVNITETQYLHSDSMQTTFFYLERLAKKLADDRCSSIPKGSIYYINICTYWPVFSTGFLLNKILVSNYLIEILINICFKLLPCLVLISALCRDFKTLINFN